MKKNITWGALICATFLGLSLGNKHNGVVRAEINKGGASTGCGLMGYYFNDSNFKDLSIFGLTNKDNLVINQKDILNKKGVKQPSYKSIVWVGYIKNNDSENVILKTSDDSNSTIIVNGETISNNGNNKHNIVLDKDKLTSIVIKYSSRDGSNIADGILNDLKLIKVNNKNEETMFNLNELTPINNADQVPASPVNDSDKDGIPDDFETDGFTVINNKAVKWNDDLTNLGVQKYVSNPYDAHTVGDPYSDYEKSFRSIPLGNNKVAYNPLVAANPIINVFPESFILSKNIDLSSSIESHTSNSKSNSHTYENSETLGTEIGGLDRLKINASYTHTEAITNTTLSEYGDSNGSSESYNTANTGYLNANVRYKNIGTGLINNAKPTTSLVLDKNTIATVHGNSALSLGADQSYPSKDQHGINLLTPAEYNSHPITLNTNQQKSLLDDSPVSIETNQTDGNFLKYINGNIEVGGPWSNYTKEIENKTASLLVNDAGDITDRQVLCKDYNDSQDHNPSLTLREALKIAYSDKIVETNGKLYFNGKSIEDDIKAQLLFDEFTEKEIMKQINDNTGMFKDVKNIFDVRLTKSMKFQFNLLDLAINADNHAVHYKEENVANGFNKWYECIGPDGQWIVPGAYQSFDHPLPVIPAPYPKYSGMFFVGNNNTGEYRLNSNAISSLSKDCYYTLTMLMKVNSSTQVSVGDQTTTVAPSGEKYQVVSFLLKNTQKKPIDKILIKTKGENAEAYINHIDLLRGDSLK